MGRIEDALKRASMAATGTPADAARRDIDVTAARPVQMVEYPEERPGDKSFRAAKPVIEHPRAARAASGAREAIRHVLRIGQTAAGKVVTDPVTPGPCVEQYRRLATTLLETQADRPLKIIMVSSALPREGKTLTSTNLALTLSTSFRRRVLLIDGDLRRPSVHEVFKVPNTAGLGEALRSDNATVPLIEVTSHLTVLPAGHPDMNPVAGLASERMRTILNEAAQRFDWVIVDSAPVGLLPDARVIGSVVDGVVLVIGAGSTDYRVVQHAVDEIGRDRIIGAVLNRISQDGVPQGGYYDDYYYSGSRDSAAV